MSDERELHDPWEPVDDWRTTTWALQAIVEADRVMRDMIWRYRRHLISPLEACP